VDIVVSKSFLREESDADLASWLVSNGASVQAGEPIAEIESSKVRLELVAPVAGQLQILVPAGEVIEADAVIGRIE
jgi:pyruvate/2-oxoglutarate dehydrogenase complex dihydrolipoamide acyltransferase (E2) component